MSYAVDGFPTKSKVVAGKEIIKQIVKDLIKKLQKFDEI